ncbi:MAG: hypothetical protein AAFR59_01715 [Bacteroidota bacterium]
MKIHHILIGAMLLLPFYAIGQDTNVPSELTTKKEKWNLQLSIQHQDLLLGDELDVGQLGVVFNAWMRPRYVLDAQRLIRLGEGVYMFGTGQISYYRNLYFDRWLSFKLGGGMEFRIERRILVSGRLEIGGGHVKNTDVQYILEDGIWVPTQNVIPPKWMPQVSLRSDLGYRVLDDVHLLDVFVNGNVTLINNPTFGPLPYGAFGIGVRYGL